MKFKINDYVINYKIIRKDNKNLYFRFDEKSVLIITAPRFIKDEEVKDLISKNSKAILKMYENSILKNKREEYFWYLGVPYEVFYDNRVDGVNIEDSSITCANELVLETFVKQECKRIFEKEIETCKKCFNNLPEFNLRLRKMKTRWGVCNTRNKIITLNTDLIGKEISLIDYVIIHEMAHFYEGNHGKNFWKIVEMIIPDYKERRKKLKE